MTDNGGCFKKGLKGVELFQSFSKVSFSFTLFCYLKCFTVNFYELAASDYYINHYQANKPCLGPALSSEPDRELHHVCLPTGSHAVMQQREISRKQC